MHSAFSTDIANGSALQEGTTDMSVTLNKCAYGCKNKGPQDFSGHTDSGQSVCNWCAGMWVHDMQCCKPVSLAKATDPITR